MFQNRTALWKSGRGNIASSSIGILEKQESQCGCNLVSEGDSTTNYRELARAWIG